MKPACNAGKKSEFMTSLSGDRVVLKTHGRIVFRGLLDSLQAEVIEAQVLASESGEADFCARLGEVLDFLRSVMAAEVKETALPPPSLFGFDAEELRRQSHNAEGNFGFVLPCYTQGRLAARINTLRAKTREAELAAVKVFGPAELSSESSAEADQTGGREDIVLALNRLSSALWWLFCEYISLRSGAPV